MLENREIPPISSFENTEIENQYFTDILIKENPRFFQEMELWESNSNMAFLSNDALISQEDKEILPPYMYFVFSKYGLTQFNCSSRCPLGIEIMNKAVKGIIELGNGEGVKDLIVSQWKAFHRVRRTKGLLKLKMDIRSLTVSGVHITNGVREFYENILTHTSLIT